MKWRRTAMQCSQCSSHSLLERQTSRSRFKTESQNSYVEKIDSLHPPLLGRVEKLPSSLTFLSVVRQSTEIELCKIESFQSRAFQLCCERRLTPSACLSATLHVRAMRALHVVSTGHGRSTEGGWVSVLPIP